MRRRNGCGPTAWVVLCFGVVPGVVSGREAPLPIGVQAVWDLGKAYRETTPTRERISINGLWSWQPADEAGETVPADHWGYYKVPAPWSSNSQTIYPHPTWKDTASTAIQAAWYQREITIPDTCRDRRIAVYDTGFHGQPLGRWHATTRCDPQRPARY